MRPLVLYTSRFPARKSLEECPGLKCDLIAHLATGIAIRACRPGTGCCCHRRRMVDRLAEHHAAGRLQDASGGVRFSTAGKGDFGRR